MQALAAVVTGIGLAVGFWFVPVDTTKLFDDRNINNLTRIRGTVVENVATKKMIIESISSYKDDQAIRMSITYDDQTVWLLGRGADFVPMATGSLPTGTQLAIFTLVDTYRPFYARYILIEPLL